MGAADEAQVSVLRGAERDYEVVADAAQLIPPRAADRDEVSGVRVLRRGRDVSSSRLNRRC